MGEQSTSLPTVDLAGQVEDNGTRQVDKADMAINVQPESAAQAPQQPESMLPKTRSQTARSQPSTLEEHIGKLDLGDDIPSWALQLSPEYDPAAGRRETEGIVTNTTPRCRRTSTIRTEQREGALKADPHQGRCLITNRPQPVELCHLVARATDHEALTKLEYVWEEGYLQLNVDSKRNLLHLRSDWHHLFDTSEWVLIPEVKVVKELSKIYLEEKRETSDLTQLCVKETYRYYFLPAPRLKEPICHFPDVNQSQHQTHFPPFLNLGLLNSHIHPQFVVFNTGQKLRTFTWDDITEMRSFLKKMIPPEDDALAILSSIQDLYKAWTKVKVPPGYRNLIGTSKRARPPSEQGQGDRSQHDPPKREGLRSATRSQGQGSQGAADRYTGGQQRALLPFRSPEEDDASSITDDTVVEDDSDWIEYIHKWQKESDGATGKWESGELNGSHDEQLATYIEEHARTPPSPGVWNSWKPTWGSRSRDPNFSDRSRFSSNDWAVFKNDMYLTRSEYPQVDM